MKKLMPFLLLAFLVLFASSFIPPAAAQGGPQTCFCVTPRNGGAATGSTRGGNQSTVQIKWGLPNFGGAQATVNPTAGQSAGSIATGLANQLAAAGLPVGPVTVDPNTGRAVFCVNARKPNVGGVRVSENDTGLRTITYRTVYRPTDWFLRGVGGAFIKSVAAGGSVSMEVFVADVDGFESSVVVEVETFPGQPGEEVAAHLVDALNAEGFEASIGEFNFGEFGVQPAIIIDLGEYDFIQGVAQTSDDEGISELHAVGADKPGFTPADVNLDGLVDTNDFRSFTKAFMNRDTSMADMNGNGRVEEQDLVIFMALIATHDDRALAPDRMLGLR